VTRAGLDGFDPDVPTPPVVLAQFEAAITAISKAGATVIDLDAAGFTFPSANGETLVLCFDFRNDLRKYFATRVGVPMANRNLNDAIAFNNAHVREEMPFFNQDLWEFCASLATGPNDPQPAFGGMTYNQALANDQASGVNGIDAALAQFHLDAVVSATDNPAWATDLLYGDHFIFGTSSLAAPEGYPIVQVPAGMSFGVPLGISFFGTAFSEPKLIKLASGFEAATHVRAKNLPTFAPTVPFNNIAGTTLTPSTQRSLSGSNSNKSALPPTGAKAKPGKENKKPHHL
jgi:amidase